MVGSHACRYIHIKSLKTTMKIKNRFGARATGSPIFMKNQKRDFNVYKNRKNICM
jgi:hypothetical protein